MKVLDNYILLNLSFVLVISAEITIDLNSKECSFDRLALSTPMSTCTVPTVLYPSYLYRLIAREGWPQFPAEIFVANRSARRPFLMSSFGFSTLCEVVANAAPCLAPPSPIALFEPAQPLTRPRTTTTDVFLHCTTKLCPSSILLDEYYELCRTGHCW